MKSQGLRMDYNTKVTITSSLLGVLTLTAVLGSVFSGQSVVQRASQEALMTGMGSAQVGSISLPGGILLDKAKGRPWTLTVQGHPYPASSERIEGFLTTAFELKRERLVGHSVTLADYGLDKPKLVTFKDSTGKTLTEVRAGSADSTGTKVYVQVGSAPEVWETDRGLLRGLDTDFNTWADLTLVPGKKASDLTRITYTGSLETSDKTQYTSFDLVKGGTPDKPTWENQLNKSAAKADNWLNQLANFRFGAYFGPQETTPVDGSGGKLVLSWGDNSKTEVTFGAKDAQNRIPASDGQRQFWINDWALSQLLYMP